MCIKADEDTATHTPIQARVDTPASGARLKWTRCQIREAMLTIQRLEDVARASGDWIWESDERHRYTWVQAAVTGVPWPRVGDMMACGRVVNWLGEPEQPLQTLHDVLDRGESFIRIVTEDPSPQGLRYVSRSAVALLRSDGSLRGFRGCARDVTQSLAAKAQLQRREQASRLAREEAEAMSQAKSVLVSKLGHELRTPLNAIVGLAQLIQARSTPDEQDAVSRWIAQIAKTGWHMVEVMDMLMELGRAGALGGSISGDPVNVAEVARDAVAIVEGEARARAVGISLDGSAAVMALGDRRAIRQVIVNLLSNAIKYNRDGGRVRLRLSPGTHARIEVHDTGAGLSDEQVARLYRPFERLGADQSAVKGFGLGLSICKELVASMGGSIDVRSAVGKGTTFTVSLPAVR